MSLDIRLQRGIAAGLLLTAALLAAAPAAQADPRGGRYKDVGHGWQGGRSRVVFHEHGDGAGPALAGLVGGFLIGTAFAHTQPVVVHERVYREAPPVAYRGEYSSIRYGYYDPYCDRTFDSLEDARWHALDHRHPRVIRVIDLDSGSCVRTLHLHDGRWIDDDDWDD